MNYKNEITVSVNMSRNELINYVKDNNFNEIDNYVVNDIYYLKDDIDLNKKTLDVLKDCIILRSIDNTKHYIMYKYKEYDENDNIIKQGKTKVEIKNIEEAKKLLEILGYKELIYINDSINVYEKNDLELCIEYVNDKYLYIEIEENKKYNTVEKLIDALKNTNIKYDDNNYFVKKAEIIFDEKYKK